VALLSDKVAEKSFHHEDAKPQRPKEKNFVTLWLSDFVVRSSVSAKG
jgi:hypothetical protein